MKSTIRVLALLATIAILVVLLVFAMPNGCTQPDEARRVLTTQGYTDIQITGYKFFMGGRDDVFSTGFIAKSPSGTTVTGAVTSGAFKGYVIRFD